ncbi:MAG: hypothetical protein V1866_01320 [archaeon]
MSKMITRRDFIGYGLELVAASMLTRCSSPTDNPIIPPTIPPAETTYAVEKKSITNGTLSTLEYQMRYKDKHFATLIAETKEGNIIQKIFDFRTNPGNDVNGWGTSLYLQPFFPGEVLNGTTIDSVVADEQGIDVKGRGVFSGGQWNSDLLFTYADHKIIANGTYDVSVSSLNNDLNLFKIASNYLIDVPLINGGYGNTGDFSQVNVKGEKLNFSWQPPNSHFPQDLNNWLSIDVIGNYYNLDSKDVKPAYKPGLKVDISTPESIMMFGVYYDILNQKNFWADNTGITPMIRPGTTKNNDFSFKIYLESVPAPQEPL